VSALLAHRRRSSRPARRGWALLSPGVILAVCVLFAAPAHAAETSATITPTLLPDKLGAKGALSLTMGYAGGEAGVPSPLRRAVLRLPAGLGIDIPELRSCAVARLRASGPSGCPAQSEIGRGHALAEVHAGSQFLTESISLWLFLGPLHGFEPTFEILGQGYTPFDQRVVFTGTALTDHPPYGEDLVMSIPPIPTLPLEPDASILTMSLTIGTDGPRRPRDGDTVTVPRSCPAGGFPFAAEFSYLDGATGSALAKVPCPQ
jgi:hypothetical protein